MLDPHCVVFKPYDDGTDVVAVSDHDLRHCRIERQKKGLPDANWIEPSQPPQVGAEHHRT